MAEMASPQMKCITSVELGLLFRTKLGIFLEWVRSFFKSQAVFCLTELMHSICGMADSADQMWLMVSPLRLHVTQVFLKPSFMWITWFCMVYCPYHAYGMFFMGSNHFEFHWPLSDLVEYYNFVSLLCSNANITSANLNSILPLLNSRYN